MEATHEANPVRVNARRIATVLHEDVFRLEDGTDFTAKQGMLSRYAPIAGDYLVVQEDGYEYFNPKEVFERKYRSL